MSEKKKHTEQDLHHEISDFLDKVDVPYEKSKEEVWESMAEQLSEQPSGQKTVWLHGRTLIAIAATLLVLLSIFSVMRFYRTTITVPKGHHLTAVLPDGSTVDLNADTKLSYHPYWWSFARTIQFEGEGFFKVKKGKKFQVISNAAKTVVLGTSFNIYNRGKAYKVTCITGKVKVISSIREEVILSPDYHAEVNENGSIRVYRQYATQQVTSWINNMFTFTSAPLNEVLKEIERQYNIRIISDATDDYFYTGFFSRDKKPEEVLDLLAKTFGFTFVKISDNEYKIIQKAAE